MREVMAQTETSVPRREVLGRQATRSDHAVNSVRGSFGEDFSTLYLLWAMLLSSPLGHSETMQDSVVRLER